MRVSLGEATFRHVYDASTSFDLKENMPPLAAREIRLGDVVVVETQIVERVTSKDGVRRAWRSLRLMVVGKLG